MLCVLAAAVLLNPLAQASIERDSYGVAKVTAATWDEAFRAFGRAAAEDRLWQMEVSRHLAKGHLEAITGASGRNSDKDMLSFRYSDAEVTEQFNALSPRTQNAFRAYTQGVNDTIEARKAAGTLPPGYAQAGITPAPWTVADSVHITVNLIRRFGTGGAGELRNMLLMEYMKLQKAKDQRLDVMDDLGWHNDPDAMTTVLADEDPLKASHLNFPAPSRAQTENHLGLLPPTNLFELAGGIRMASMQESFLAAERLGVAHKLGSYAIVVGPERSTSGHPMLLSAPQMGHTMPSPVSEIAIDCPEIQVQGIHVPGIPAVVIGWTPNMAWGLTSGVADIEDIYFSELDGDQYVYNGQKRPIEKVEIATVDPAKPFIQERTHIGPVVLKSPTSKALYSKASSLWKTELACIDGVYDIYSATKPADIDALAGKLSATFNFFFAFKGGDFGWRYIGFVPQRASGYDPRLPLPLTPQTEWKGYIPVNKMPHVTNPASGLIINWNNKPANWWPNWDTPVWGSIFRSEVLRDSIPDGKLNVSHLERAAWMIARKDTLTTGDFADMMRDAAAVMDDDTAAKLLAGYDGWQMKGSLSDAYSAEAFRQLRKGLFEPWIGNLMGESTFAQAVQPPTVMKALQGETKFNYLGEKTARQHIQEALTAALEITKQRPAGYQPTIINYGGEVIPYNNRGTYIQITEFGPVYRARSVSGPGVAESGDHSVDQADLVRDWTFKPMWGW